MRKFLCSYAKITVIISRPCGLVVLAHASPRDLKAAPALPTASSTLSKSRVERASRSSRVTISIKVKRKQTWLGASTYRRPRSAGWQRPALSRQAWSPREEGRRMKEPKLPRVPPCSEAGAKLRSPVSAFFGKIAEGHAAGSATGILLRNPCLGFGPRIIIRLASR
jgi:hypothetical protein